MQAPAALRRRPDEGSGADPQPVTGAIHRPTLALEGAASSSPKPFRLEHDEKPPAPSRSITGRPRTSPCCTRAERDYPLRSSRRRSNCAGATRRGRRKPAVLVASARLYRDHPAGRHGRDERLGWDGGHAGMAACPAWRTCRHGRHRRRLQSLWPTERRPVRFALTASGVDRDTGRHDAAMRRR
jgi:hypothetical protein